MAIWRFSLIDGQVGHGGKKRLAITGNGCNEPFKNRYWCPKRKWFSKEPCPFINQRECRNFDSMCGRRLTPQVQTSAARS